MTTPATVESAQALRDDTRNLLIERIHAGLWIILCSISLFAILDLFINRAVLKELWILKALQLVWLAGAYLVIRRAPSVSRAVNVALLTVLMMALGTALSSKYTGDLNSTPLLMVTLCLVTATLFPWGLGPQIFVGICTTGAVLLNRLWVQPSETTVFAHVLTALAVAFIASMWASRTLQRYRSERQRAEEILAEIRTRQHQAELAHAARLSSLGEMAAGLAHELNQPLSAIVSYARGCALRMRADDLDPDAFLEVIEEISSQAFRASEVLRRIREFLRHGELQREAADLNDLVREAARFATGEARELGVQLDLALAFERCPVGVDKIQVEQVILNLVRNGFDAMARIPATDRRLRIATRRENAAVAEVTITDSGDGIDPDHATKLFDPFFTTKRDGLGLGLSISRSIIEAHGGRLWVTPNTSRGSAFHFTLPLSASEADAA